MAKEKESVRAEEVIPVTTGAVLKKLLNKAKQTKKQTSEIAGEFGQEVANAVENNHLHRVAFGVVKRIAGLSTAEKRAEAMFHLEHYLEVSGLIAEAEKVGRLDLGDNDKADNVENLEEPRQSVN